MFTYPAIQVNFGEGKKGRGGGIQQNGGRIPVASSEIIERGDGDL